VSNDPTSKTAQDLITGSLRKIGVYAPGETLSGADATDALDTLNGLLDILSNEDLAIFNSNENVFALNNGQFQYSIGVGAADWNVQRPLRITQAYSRITSSNGGVDFQCAIRPLAEYSQISMKQLPGPWPKRLFYNSTFPLGTVYIWPVPTIAVSFHVWTDALLQSVALADTMQLPQGYFLGLQWMLAELLCPEYGKQITPDIARFARAFRRILKTTNERPSAISSIEATGMVNGQMNDASFVIHGGFL
jgi:hypothetical protein